MVRPPSCARTGSLCADQTAGGSRGCLWTLGSGRVRVSERDEAQGFSASPTAGGSRGCLWTTTRRWAPTRTSGGRGSRSRCATKLTFQKWWSWATPPSSPRSRCWRWVAGALDAVISRLIEIFSGAGGTRASTHRARRLKIYPPKKDIDIIIKV